ncbi:hypothetical protein PHYPSEUDO_010916 [Phytophthora pseudosyringae]|uniref:Uncharacterized protein n=1 Tax=Phytophthora pseudosyringae TaxID=221518 RepID=A0A8T1VCI5_9STRA|nr:hypothetical protein PHYPSEUDO_010916 [Phytophthora pseudosyringae]
MATLIDLEPFKAEAMPALQDPPASDALGRVQSLQKLCLKAIGRRLQRFCKSDTLLRLHPTLAQTLSTAEKQLICSYDLSRLDVFEAQAFLQTIDKWCTKVERSKRQRHGDWTPKRVDRAMKGFLRYVLLPPAESQLQEPFRELALALGLVAGRKLELRAPTPSVKPRRKWVSGAVECQNDIGEEGTAPSASSPEVIPLDEIVYFRLPVASVGCGIIAEMLQHSSSIVKLRLNNCHITDAGAILLASGIRLATMLELLDVSNEESVYWKGESMDNEIRNNGVRAIALALERNQSVKQVHLQYE